MSQVERIENAIIDGTMLGVEDHGIITCFVFVKFDGAGAGFGGYAMDTYDKALDRRVGTAYGMEFIARILSVVGVEKWEDLKGKPVRVKSGGLGGRVTDLGHFIKNEWVNPDSLAMHAEVR